MRRLYLVGQTVDSCLNNETLERLIQEQGKVFQTLNKTKLFLDLYEHAMWTVMVKLHRDLERDEKKIIYNRVLQFLMARGLD